MKSKDNKEKNTTVLEKHKKATSVNYMMGMTVLVIVLIVIVNMLVSSINAKYRTIDLTKEDVFSLTEDTKNLLDKLDKQDKEITIYMVLEDITDRNDDLYRIVEKYVDYSDKIKYEVVNPVTNPTFLENREYVSNGSIIVESGERSKGIELSSMIITSDDANTGNTYYFYDIEGQITSAINYCMVNDTPKAYMLRGATRDTLDSSLVTEIKKQNIDVESINLENEGAIPEDADIIILDQPVKDISDKEYEMLSKFMDNGGSMLMFEYYNHNEDSELDNIEKLLSKYGISVEYGAALETNTDYQYDSKSYYSKPKLEEHEITEEFMNKEDLNLMVAMGDAIQIGETPDSVTVDPLLTSTSRAYYKSAKYKSGGSMSQLASDPTGTFNYAVAITDDISDDIQSRMVYFSTYSFAETDMFSESYGSNNASFVVRCMQWLARQDDTVSISIKNRTYSNLIYTVTAKQRILYIVVFIIPAGVMIYGGYVWFKRRKR